LVPKKVLKQPPLGLWESGCGTFWMGWSLIVGGRSPKEGEKERNVPPIPWKGMKSRPPKKVGPKEMTLRLKRLTWL